MNLTAAALKLMAAKGLTLEDVAEIVAANEQTRDPTAAERKRRQRAREKSRRDVTRDPAPLNDNILNPPPEPQDVSNETSAPSVLPEHVLEAWNVMADEAGLPKARMTPERRKKLGTFCRRWQADDITEAIWAIPRSRFLCGENDRGWKADFDFLLQPKSFTRLLEGTYGQ